jgi:hypothetical protein
MMSSGTPEKTALAQAMREWISIQTRPFTMTAVCEALQLQEPQKRQRVFRAKGDFEERREIIRVSETRHERGYLVVHYKYNPSWKREYRQTLRGPMLKKILKGMYISSTFAVSDIVRLSEAPCRAYVDQVARRLAKAGHLQKVSRRRCLDSTSVETLWRIKDRDKFRVEVM